MAKNVGRKAEQMKATIGKLVQRMAGDTGEEAAGRAISKGVRGFTTGKQKEATKLWERVDALIPPEKVVEMPSTRKMLSDLTGKGVLSKEFASPTIKRVAKIAEEVADLPYSELRELRSVVGAKLSSADLISDMPRAELKRLYGALTADIKKVAFDLGGDDGIRAYNRANNYTRSLHTRVDDILEPILKRATPEKIFRAVKGADESTLRTIKRSLKPAQWRKIVGAVVQDLGTARPSQQNELGEAFSAETYLTEWNKLKPGVRRLLFSGPGAGAYERDLNAITESASLMRENARTLANPSGTARLVTNVGAFTTGIGAALAGNITIPAGLALQAGGANVTARLFASPKFVRWLAATSTASIDRLPSLMSRLTQDMRSEPEDIQEAAQEYLSQLETQNQ
jgi:hypothetical protein